MEQCTNKEKEKPIPFINKGIKDKRMILVIETNIQSIIVKRKGKYL